MHQPQINQETLKHYRTRWQLVTAIEAQERSRMTVEQRLQQLNWLFQSGLALEIYAKAVAKNQREAEVARQRWNQLKAKLV